MDKPKERAKRKVSMFRAAPMDFYEPAPPKFKAGDLVLMNGGIYMVRSIERRMVRNKKSKGDWLYDIGNKSPVAENSLAAVSDEMLARLNLQRN
jgi:hypothetical protein